MDPLDKAADHEKAKIVAGTELMKEKGKICGDVFREIEQTIRSLRDRAEGGAGGALAPHFFCKNKNKLNKT